MKEKTFFFPCLISESFALLYAFFIFLVRVVLKGLQETLFLGVIWSDDASANLLLLLAHGMLFSKQLQKQQHQVDLLQVTKGTDKNRKSLVILNIA